MIENFEIKFATVNDVSLILSFIKELAEYECLLHQVEATEDILRETLFGDKVFAEVIIGYFYHEPVSCALFFYDFSTFLGRPGLYLEDLYVKPHARGHGIGKYMLCYLAKLAKERNCQRLEWGAFKWLEPTLAFYKKIGAQAMDEWTVFRLSGEALDNLATEKDSGYTVSKPNNPLLNNRLEKVTQ